MTRGLTRRQEEVYQFLSEYREDHGYPPTLREICTFFGMASTRAASDHLDALERKGKIHRKRELSRGIEFVADKKIRGKSLPLVGKVAAGAPLLAVENIVDEITVDESLARAEKSFLLEVQGDSMIAAHICPGDYIIVKPQQTAEDGEIVVALLGEEATVKRLERKGARIRLIPENPTMAPIPVPRPEELSIVGVVTGLIRRM